MSQDAPSGKLIRLDAEIAVEPDPVKRGCLRGERAGLLARQGFSELARQGLDSLRQDFDRNPDAGVSIWMQIAEGWMAHYNGSPSLAKDRMQRAYALSAASCNKDLQALSAAWLAHLAYSRDSFAEMVRYLHLSKQNVRDDDHSTLARSSLVLAQSFHFANRFDLAQPWYLKARSHAMADKDDPALSVLSYNMAGRKAFYLVQASIFGEPTPSAKRSTNASIESSHNFDQMFKIAVVGAWVRVVQAMACSAVADFSESLKLYESYLEEAIATGLRDQSAFFKADMAWCYVNLRQYEKARLFVEESSALAHQKMYVEDKVITFGRLGQVYWHLGNTDLAKINNKFGNTANAELQALRDELLNLILPFQPKAS